MAQLPESLMSSLWIVEDLDGLAVILMALTARAILDTAGHLPQLQWRVLVELGDRGPLRLASLASRLPSSMPATSRLVKRMTQRGLITTRQVPTDGRGISVELSLQGYALYAAVIERRQALIVEAIGSSSLPAGLHDGLVTLRERLHAGSPAPAIS